MSFSINYHIRKYVIYLNKVLLKTFTDERTRKFNECKNSI